MRNTWLKISALVLAATPLMAALLVGCRGGDTPDGIPPTASNITANTSATVTSEPVIGTIYSLSYRYEEGKFSLIDVHVESGSAPYRKGPPDPGYKYEVLSLGGEVLGSFRFVLPLLHYDFPDPQTGQLGGGIIEQKTMDGAIQIPYFVNGATINLYDPNGTRVLSVNVRKLANPSQKELTNIVASILAAPYSYEGKQVTVVGYFRGWDLLHEADIGPPVTKSDWVIKDASGAIYVAARSKPERGGHFLDPSSHDDINTILKIVGVIRVTDAGQPYIELQSMEIPH